MIRQKMDSFFNNEHGERGCSKAFPIHHLSLHMVQRLLLLSLEAVKMCFWYVFCVLRSQFLNHQLVVADFAENSRSGVFSEATDFSLCTSHLPKSLRNRFEHTKNKNTYWVISESPLVLWSSQKKSGLSRVALEGEGFQFVKNIEQLEQRGGRCLCLFSSLCNTFQLACVCICKPKKIRRSNVFVSWQTSAWQIEWQGFRDPRNFKQSIERIFKHFKHFVCKRFVKKCCKPNFGLSKPKVSIASAFWRHRVKVFALISEKFFSCLLEIFQLRPWPPQRTSRAHERRSYRCK